MPWGSREAQKCPDGSHAPEGNASACDPVIKTGTTVGAIVGVVATLSVVFALILLHFRRKTSAVLAETKYALEKETKEKEQLDGEKRILRDANRQLKVEVRVLRQKVTAAQQDLIDKVLAAEAVARLGIYRVNAEAVTLQTRIGQGAFGEVWKASCMGERVAVKRLLSHRVDENETTKFREEALMMAKLQSNAKFAVDGKLRSHRNLVQMLHCCWTGEMMIVLPFYELGSMDDALQAISAGMKGYEDHDAKVTWHKDGALSAWALGIVAGMRFLHEWTEEGKCAPVLHRDLKTQNVLMDGSTSTPPATWGAIISDFGESKAARDETMTTVGTPLFVAPEVMQGCQYDERADIYSFGMMLLAMASFRKGGLVVCWVQAGVPRISEQALAIKRPAIPASVPLWLDGLVRRCWSGLQTKRPRSFFEIEKRITRGLEEEVAGSSEVDYLDKSPKAYSEEQALAREDARAGPGGGNKSTDEDLRRKLQESNARNAALRKENDELRAEVARLNSD